MSDRLFYLFFGAATAAFSIASFGAAVGNTALLVYAGLGGFLLGVCSQVTNAFLKGQHRYYEPVFSARWNDVLMVTGIISVSLVLLRLTLDFRVPEPVYGLGAATLAISAVCRLLPVFRT